MPDLTWRSPTPIEPEREYVVMASRLPVGRLTAILRFMLTSFRIGRQLRGSRGIVWYLLRADLGARRLWTASAWEDAAALDAFVKTSPHSEVMRRLHPYVTQPRFQTWQEAGRDLPPAWERVMSRLE
jgi:quinol monooxygenase YgiN